jgi:hypothetical protein
MPKVGGRLLGPPVECIRGVVLYYSQLAYPISLGK